MVPRNLFAKTSETAEKQDSEPSAVTMNSTAINNKPIVEAMETSQVCENLTILDDPMNGESEVANTVLSVQVVNNDPVGVAYEEDLPWCHIRYFEHNVRAGELFKGNDYTVIIDGFEDSGDGHMHLGSFHNHMRHQISQNIRNLIGYGVVIYYTCGEVFLENFSDIDVFVLSRNLNQLENRDLLDVVKLESGQKMRIFNGVFFADVLAKMVTISFEAVYSLIQTCQIKISFGKGFGGGKWYRKEATETPCWMEVSLITPLKWLDNVLYHMNGPDRSTSS